MRLLKSGQYIDPVIYEFCFSAISPNEEEYTLKEMYCDQLRRFCELACKCLYAGKNGVLQYSTTYHQQSSEIGIWAQVTPKDCIPQLWEHMIANINDKKVTDVELYFPVKKQFQAFCQAPGDLALQYKKMFGRIDEKHLVSHRDKIMHWLHCPNETLRGILVPFSWIRANLWEMQMSIRPVSYREESQWGKVIANIPETWQHKQLYAHRMVVKIPRFLIAPEEFINQHEAFWCNALQELGTIFPLSFGTIRMDSGYHIGTGDLSVMEHAVLRQHNHINMLNQVPYCAWGMMLSADCVKALREASPNWEIVFDEIRSLPNGGAFMKLTPHMDCISKEKNDALAEIFAPLLPEITLHIISRDILPSFRMSNSKLVYDETHHCVQVIRSCSQ